ncbi:MAG: helix-turn-helix transcriptional regulator [Thermoprotei archaeon]
MARAWSTAVLLGLLAFAITHLTPITAALGDGSARIAVYYNGTVVADLAGVSQFRLFGSNVTNLNVVGSTYYLRGDTVYIDNATPVRITYKASFSNGVINVSEPYNFTLVLYLPYAYSIVYASPGPTSVGSFGDLYSATFRGNGVLVSFVEGPGSPPAPSAPSQAPTSPSQNQGLISVLVAGLIAVNAALITIALLLIRTLRGRRPAVAQARPEATAQTAKEAQENGESEPGTEEAVLDESTLNDRDWQVLEAIKSGANTLADIVKVTGLPKTTAYRRVKKLVRLGLVKEVRERGKVRYEVQDKGGTNSP